MHKPHGRYEYCTDIKATIFGVKDENVVLFHDFECEVDVHFSMGIGGETIVVWCSDVLIDGKSLRHGDGLARSVLVSVIHSVDAELEAAGPIWDKVREAEGLTMIGQPGDPDARWVRS